MLYVCCYDKKIGFEYYDQRYVGQVMNKGNAVEAIMLQADGHELDHIKKEVPSLFSGKEDKRVVRFYGDDAVKAALTFCEFK